MPHHKAVLPVIFPPLIINVPPHATTTVVGVLPVISPPVIVNVPPHTPTPPPTKQEDELLLKCLRMRIHYKKVYFFVVEVFSFLPETHVDTCKIWLFSSLSAPKTPKMPACCITAGSPRNPNISEGVFIVLFLISSPEIPVSACKT